MKPPPISLDSIDSAHLLHSNFYNFKKNSAIFTVSQKKKHSTSCRQLSELRSRFESLIERLSSFFLFDRHRDCCHATGSTKHKCAAPIPNSILHTEHLSLQIRWTLHTLDFRVVMTCTFSNVLAIHQGRSDLSSFSGIKIRCKLVLLNRLHSLVFSCS